MFSGMKMTKSFELYIFVMRLHIIQAKLKSSQCSSFTWDI